MNLEGVSKYGSTWQILFVGDQLVFIRVRLVRLGGRLWPWPHPPRDAACSLCAGGTTSAAPSLRYGGVRPPPCEPPNLLREIPRSSEINPRVPTSPMQAPHQHNHPRESTTQASPCANSAVQYNSLLAWEHMLPILAVNGLLSTYGVYYVENF